MRSATLSKIFRFSSFLLKPSWRTWPGHNIRLSPALLQNHNLEISKKTKNGKTKTNSQKISQSVSQS